MRGDRIEAYKRKPPFDRVDVGMGFAITGVLRTRGGQTQKRGLPFQDLIFFSPQESESLKFTL